jgi:hypothetical protein
MNLLFWGLTISMLGKVMLGVGVLIAHTQLAHERRIDKLVLKSFRLEHSLTIAGLILIIAGYFMEIYFYQVDTPLFSCAGQECVNVAAAILSI